MFNISEIVDGADDYEISNRESENCPGEFSVLAVHKSATLKGSVRFFGGGSIVVVGAESKINLALKVMGGGAAVVIGREVKGRLEAVVAGDVKITVGDGTSMVDVYVAALEGGADGWVSIGKDCLFSDKISLRSSDGHSIFDIVSGDRLNVRKPIVVQDHVWIGSGASIAKGVTVGFGSVIGQGSLVTKDVDPQSIYAGRPAVKLRSGIVWDRERADHYSETKSYRKNSSLRRGLGRESSDGSAE